MKEDLNTSKSLYIIRVALGAVLRYSPSGRLNDFILWPLSKRLFGKYEEIVAIDGAVRMRVYGDMEDMVNKTLLFRSRFCRLSWEPATARLVRALMPRKKCIVVAGAHIGYYPLLAAVANPEALIFAFEPNPLNYKRFLQNIDLNGASNIRAVRAALGDTSGEKKMFFDFGQSSLVDSRASHSGEGNVEVTTLDNFLEDKKMVPDLMIFDAEGYESNILRGAEKVIDSDRPDVIFELNPKALRAANSSPDSLFLIFESRGYALFIIEDDYKHKMNVACDEKIKLLKYNGEFPPNVSFVNIFATIQPTEGESIY